MGSFAKNLLTFCLKVLTFCLKTCVIQQKAVLLHLKMHLLNLHMKEVALGIMSMKVFTPILIGVVLLSGCGHREVAHGDSSKTDSISRMVSDRLLKSDNMRALELVDSADAAGWLTDVDAEMLRLRVISRDEGRIAEAVDRYEQLLDNEDLTPALQIEVLSQLVYLSRVRRSDEDILEYGTRYVELCRRQGKPTIALNAQAEMGSSLIRLGRTEEGFAMIDDAIQQLDQVRRFTEMDLCVLAMKSKIRTLIDCGQMDPVIGVGERMVAKLADFSQHPEVYDDGSRRMPSEDRRAGYVDFYTGQAYAFIIYAYARKGEMESAKEYSRLFDQTNYSHSYSGRKQMASAWCMLEQYDKMTAVYGEMAKAMAADTVNHDYCVMLYNYAKMADRQGHHAASASYWRRYANILSLVNDKERIAAAEESAARYHEQERLMELQQERNQRKRNEYFALFLLIILVMAIIYAITIVHRLRETRRKNAVLSKQITESVDYRAKYLLLKSHHELSKVQKDKESAPKLVNMSDAELFEFLRVVIVGEQLYLDANFDRKYLMERFNLSKERIGSAFAHGSTYGSISKYIRECRLSYGAVLLLEKPELTISEVALSSGFSNVNVFAREFKNEYALTPKDFRESNMIKNNDPQTDNEDE